MSNEEEKVRKKPKMPMTPAEKEEAHLMFVTGASISEIQKRFNLSSMNNFYGWVEKGNWYDERDAHFKKIAEKTTQALLKKSVNSTENALSEIQIMRDKAFASINDNKVNPEKFGEASKSYLDALEMERKLRIEGLQLSFISDVADVLRREIQDPEVMNRIFNGLKEVYSSYQKASLPLKITGG